MYVILRCRVDFERELGETARVRAQLDRFRDHLRVIIEYLTEDSNTNNETHLRPPVAIVLLITHGMNLHYKWMKLKPGHLSENCGGD